jgi:RimJ/RimL family protein N-acetyltransferase
MLASMVELETERLLLRTMVAEDAGALMSVFSDPRVMAAFGAKPFDRVDMDRWVDRNLRHQAEHGYGLFTVVLRATGEVIGDCGLEHMDIGDELGYDLRSDHRNRGLATEAASAVRDYAFGALGLPRLVSLVRVGNDASRRVAEKIGMRLVKQTERGGAQYWVFGIDAGSAPTSSRAKSRCC